MAISDEIRTLYLPDNGESGMNGSVGQKTSSTSPITPIKPNVKEVTLHNAFVLYIKPVEGYTIQLTTSESSLSTKLIYSDGYYKYADPNQHLVYYTITIRFIPLTSKINLDTSVAIKQLMIPSSDGKLIDVTQKLLAL